LAQAISTQGFGLRLTKRTTIRHAIEQKRKKPQQTRT